MTAETGLFELPEDYLTLQREARALASGCADVAARADEADRLDPDVRQRLAASGLCSVVVAGEFGGRFAEVDSLAVTVVREALAFESAHLDSMFAMQGIGSFAISRRRVGRGAQAVASAGRLDWRRSPRSRSPSPRSGPTSARSPPRSRSMEDELVVNGHKSFITNAGDADFYSVLCKEGDGYSLVLVPAETPGVSVTSPHQVIAPHVLGDVVFDDVRVPVDQRLGEPGNGFKLMLATLATFRVSVAGAAVGLAQAALEEALRHDLGPRAVRGPARTARSRPCEARRELGRDRDGTCLVYRAAAAAARDPLTALHLSSIAKVGATEMAGRTVDRCVQVMGRFGLLRGSKIERLYREARPMRIYEGSTEVILDSLAKKLVKDRTGAGR